MATKLDTVSADTARQRRHRERLRRAPWNSDRVLGEALGAATAQMAALGMLNSEVVREIRRRAIEKIVVDRGRSIKEQPTVKENAELEACLDVYLRDGKGSLI